MCGQLNYLLTKAFYNTLLEVRACGYNEESDSDHSANHHSKPTMIRSFTLRDIPLVHRLSEQGMVFHTESALTHDVRPLREALVNMLIGGQYPTYVWKGDGEDDGAAGFAQLRQAEDESHANIICLGSKSKDDMLDEETWLPFLEQLTAEAGRQGIQSLIAEVSESGNELPMLRKAGFAVYTRQDVWACDTTQIARTHNAHLRFTAATATDEWDIHLLYANLVPRLIQLVEPVPPDTEQAWVLRDETGDLVAFVHFNEGTAATWLRVFVHPEAQEHGEDIIAAILQLKPPTADQPLYCAVRRYQSWLQTPLEQLGFVYGGSQALMVKHTVQHARKHVSKTKREVQGQPAVAQRNWFSQPYQKTMRLSDKSGPTGSPTRSSSNKMNDLHPQTKSTTNKGNQCANGST